MSCYHPHFADNWGGMLRTHHWSSHDHGWNPSLSSGLRKDISDFPCLVSLIESIWGFQKSWGRSFICREGRNHSGRARQHVTCEHLHKRKLNFRACVQRLRRPQSTRDVLSARLAVGRVWPSDSYQACHQEGRKGTYSLQVSKGLLGQQH